MNYSTATLISGLYVDKQGRKYYLALEPARDLGNGHYIIQREFPVEVWQANS